MQSPYIPRRRSAPQHLAIRTHRYHLHVWGDPAKVSPEQPLLVMTHGWMDVGASFQFLVDELARVEGDQRCIVAPDWRGYGRSEGPHTDTYWFPDYLGDLDGLLDALSPQHPVDLLGHSMGGNVVMAYGGVRPARIRRLINLEGFGLPRSRASQWPGRLTKWMDELKTPQSLAAYDSLQEVAQRLMKIHPRMAPDKAAWLAPHWSERTEQGRWQVLGDPAHKRVNPALYQVDEHMAAWERIEAPLLWVEGTDTETVKWWGDRYSKAEFYERLAVVRQVERVLLPDCGHMLHIEQPQSLARAVLKFLSA